MIFSWHDKALAWQDKDFAWEFLTVDRVTIGQGEEIIAHWLLDFIGENFRIWSGDSVLSYDGNEYQGSGQFISLSNSELYIDQQQQRLTATIVAGNNEIRSRFIRYERIHVVEIVWIISLDGGATFLPTGRRYRGRVNAPTYSDGLYTVELEPTLSDQHRQRPRTWSHETQQRIRTGDRGFEYASQLVDGTKKQQWPA